MARSDDVSQAWEKNAGQWLAWARTPAHDVYYSELNLPAFAELVPAAGRRSLDVGCGEGRLGRWLAGQGHRVAGIDSSATLAQAAREAGGYEEVVCADATSLLREPQAATAAVQRAPELAPAARRPFFLHMRCRLRQPGD